MTTPTIKHLHIMHNTYSRPIRPTSPSLPIAQNATMNYTSIARSTQTPLNTHKSPPSHAANTSHKRARNSHTKCIPSLIKQLIHPNNIRHHKTPDANRKDQHEPEGGFQWQDKAVLAQNPRQQSSASYSVNDQYHDTDDPHRRSHRSRLGRASCNS